MKLSVIYDSKTNNTATMAAFIAEGMNGVPGVEARSFHYSELDEDFVKDSKGVVFGSPTYMAGPTADFYTFLEKRSRGLNLAGKLGGVFATERFIHGRAEFVMQIIAGHLLMHGMMLYSVGNAKSEPFIHLGPVEVSTMGTDAFRDLFLFYGEKFAEQAVEVFGI